MTSVKSLPVAGCELDALVAERVMGWIPLGIGPRGITAGGAGSLAAGWVGFWDGNCTRWTSMPTPSEDDEEDRATPWSPSTDIAAVWEVVEKLHGDGIYMWLDGLRFAGEVWRCWFGYQSKERRHSAHGESESAPLAICLAALQAVGPLSEDQTP